MVSDLVPKNIFVEDDKVWFVPNNIEGFFYMDINSEKCCCISDEAIYKGKHDFGALGKYQNYLILGTWCKEGSVTIFDIDTRKVVLTIDISRYGICIIDNIIVKDDMIYLVNNSSMKPGIFVMNGSTFNIVDIIDLHYGFSQESENSNYPMRPFSNDYIVKGNTITLTATLSHLLIEVNLLNRTVKYTNIECGLSEFVTISDDGHSYWIMDENGKIIRWDGDNVLLEMDLPSCIQDLKLELNERQLECKKVTKGYRSSYMYFNNSVYYNNKIFWIPGRTNQIVYICCDDLSVGSVYLPEYPSKIPMVTTRVASYIVRDDEMILFTSHENIMVKIRWDDLNVVICKLICENKTEKIKVKYEEGISERIVFPYRLQDFLETGNKGASWNKEEEHGQKIYKFLKDGM